LTPLIWRATDRRAYTKEIIRANKLYDGEYVEPYSGGAGIGLELLFQEYVNKIHVNDLSQAVYSFWNAVVNAPPPERRWLQVTA